MFEEIFLEENLAIVPLRWAYPSILCCSATSGGCNVASNGMELLLGQVRSIGLWVCSLMIAPESRDIEGVLIAFCWQWLNDRRGCSFHFFQWVSNFFVRTFCALQKSG